MFSISNKHEEFFDYLMSNAEVFHQEAVIAETAMKNPGDLTTHLKDFAKLQEQADKTNMEVIRKLAVVFITPIDREDFYRLSCCSARRRWHSARASAAGKSSAPSAARFSRCTRFMDSRPT